MLIFVASILATVLVHEAGHRVAGILQGWKCIRFGFGPYEFYPDGWRWRAVRGRMVWGGYIGQVPATFRNFRRQKALTLLGGPLASAMFCLIMARLARVPQWSMEYSIYSTLAYGSLVACFELVPYRFLSICSDGARLWTIIRSGDDLDWMQRDFFSATSDFTRMRYRDWPRDVLERLAATGDHYGTHLAYLHYLDCGDFETAGLYLDRMMKDSPEQITHYDACEALCFAAMHKNDPAEVGKWLSHALSCKEPSLRGLSEAAAAWSEGWFDEARGFANGALEYIESRPPCGSLAFRKERLQSLLKRIAVSQSVTL